MPSTNEEPWTGRTLGDFEIVREVGRGGMGVVFEARQLSLNRRVALKVTSSALGLTGKAIERFRREAEAAAKLHHTNIVPVYATGEQDGAYYYAMELVEGSSLDRVLRLMRDPAPPVQAQDRTTPPSVSEDLALTGPYQPKASAPETSPTLSSSPLGLVGHYFDTAARTLAEVADALEYAHQQGVVHRDIKPSNLLLSPGGRLYLTDFGLARMLEQPGMTVTGEFVGTPMYMAPEQIAAGRVPIDHRADVYSLGATLYEVLTLQPPFTGDRRDQVIAQVMHKEPVAPRRLNAKVPVDLETICLKAMDKDPDRRYQTAGAMADDLRRYVNRFAIAARRAGPLARAKQWARRHPGVAALLGCLLVALLCVGYFAYQTRLAQDLLRADQRQAAVDKAILEALSGDAQAALQAIAEAKDKGAEPGQLNMLRGLVELHRSRPKEALVYLEQADRQLPNSIAVRALLAKAFLDDGQWQRVDEMYTLLERFEPKTPEDHLFLGLSQAENDPNRALRTLDAAPARSRHSPVARFAKAVAQTMLAQMTGRVEDAEQALDDFRKVDLSDNPLLLYNRVRAHLVAAHAYGPKDPRQDAALKQAARDVERLAAYRENPIAVLGRCYYYFVQRDDEAVLEEVRQARKKNVEDSITTGMEISILYGRKQFDEALRVSQTRKSTDNGAFQLITRGIVLGAILGRKEEAEKSFTDGIRGYKGGSILGIITAYLQLLGPEFPVKTRLAALEIRERSSHLIPNSRNRWYHDLLAFHAGLMEAEELLKKAGESRFNQCEGYFYIGLRQLADGKRAEAKTCFTRSFETGVFIYTEYIWSRAFLARIDDPEWLPWCK